MQRGMFEQYINNKARTESLFVKQAIAIYGHCSMGLTSQPQECLDAGL